MKNKRTDTFFGLHSDGIKNMVPGHFFYTLFCTSLVNGNGGDRKAGVFENFFSYARDISTHGKLADGIRTMFSCNNCLFLPLLMDYKVQKKFRD